MPAKPRIPSERVLEAIREWGGNVSAAAEMLGIHPKNLRERLTRLDVDLPALRTGTPAVVRVARIDTFDTVRHVSTGTHGPKVAPRTVTGGARMSKVPLMTAQAAEVAENDGEAAQFRASTAPARAVRVKPTFQERLREAKIQVIRETGIDTDEQILFEQFCEEGFDPWLRAKLAPVAPKTPRNGKRGADEGGRG